MSEQPIIFRTGDAVKITTGGRTVRGTIELASGNGRSLALGFDAMLNPEGGLGGYAGMMPVMWSDEHNRFEDLGLSLPVELERA